MHGSFGTCWPFASKAREVALLTLPPSDRALIIPHRVCPSSCTAPAAFKAASAATGPIHLRRECCSLQSSFPRPDKLPALKLRQTPNCRRKESMHTASHRLQVFTKTLCSKVRRVPCGRTRRSSQSVLPQARPCSKTKCGVCFDSRSFCSVL